MAIIHSNLKSLGQRLTFLLLTIIVRLTFRSKFRAVRLFRTVFFKEKILMKIQDNAFVSIEYTLSLDSDEVIDRSDPDKPFGFIFGGSQVIVGLQKGLEGMEQGQSATFTVEPEEGYGQPIQELLREIPREQFPGDMDIEWTSGAGEVTGGVRERRGGGGRHEPPAGRGTSAFRCQSGGGSRGPG
jgi:hypothetical protein